MVFAPQSDVLSKCSSRVQVVLVTPMVQHHTASRVGPAEGMVGLLMQGDLTMEATGAKVEAEDMNNLLLEVTSQLGKQAC